MAALNIIVRVCVNYLIPCQAFIDYENEMNTATAAKTTTELLTTQRTLQPIETKTDHRLVLFVVVFFDK